MPVIFHFYQGSPPDALNVYYFPFGIAGNMLIPDLSWKPLPKIQLLIHPYWWEEGFDNIAKFGALAREIWGYAQGMSEECHHFPRNSSMKRSKLTIRSEETTQMIAQHLIAQGIAIDLIVSIDPLIAQKQMLPIMWI